tara:strand:- start:24654 stop:25550 length:897 start_codon:yes stop_codon:yes gene_type:complete
VFKKIIFSSLFLFFTASLISQDYEPILKEGSFWDVVIQNHAGRYVCDYGKAFRYEIDKDTIFNGKSYKKIVRYRMVGTDDIYNEDITCIVPPYKVDLVGTTQDLKNTNTYLRESITEKKVYILKKMDNNNFVESILYDFTLKVGDVLKNHKGWFDMKVIEIDYVDGRKRYKFYNGYEYIEGIGSNQGITTFYYPDYGWSYKLICSGNDNDSNNCSETLNLDNINLSDIKIFPNPVNDILKIENTKDITVKIFSIAGSLLKTNSSKTDIEMNISSFKTGIYILEISNSIGVKRSKIIKL